MDLQGLSWATNRAGKIVISDKITSPSIKSPALQITVQMIMSSASGNTALIDGKPYKVGQKLNESAWTISKIDGEARSVTLENSQTGQSVVVQVQVPDWVDLAFL